MWNQFILDKITSGYHTLSALMRPCASVKHVVHIHGSPVGSDELTSRDWLWCIFHSVVWKWAVLQLAEQMTTVDVARNRCGASCMVGVLPKLVVNVLSKKKTCDVEKQESICVWCSCHENRSLLVFVRLSTSPVPLVAFYPGSYLDASHRCCSLDIWIRFQSSICYRNMIFRKNLCAEQAKILLMFVCEMHLIL